jgi:hypothetical protein
MLGLWTAGYGCHYGYQRLSLRRNMETQLRQEREHLKIGGGHAEVEFSKLQRVSWLHKDVERLEKEIRKRHDVQLLVKKVLTRNPMTSTELHRHLGVLREGLNKTNAVAPEGVAGTIKKIEAELSARETVKISLAQIYEGPDASGYSTVTLEGQLSDRRHELDWLRRRLNRPLVQQLCAGSIRKHRRLFEAQQIDAAQYNAHEAEVTLLLHEMGRVDLTVAMTQVNTLDIDKRRGRAMQELRDQRQEDAATQAAYERERTQLVETDFEVPELVGTSLGTGLARVRRRAAQIKLAVRLRMRLAGRSMQAAKYALNGEQGECCPLPTLFIFCVICAVFLAWFLLPAISLAIVGGYTGPDTCCEQGECYGEPPCVEHPNCATFPKLIGRDVFQAKCGRLVSELVPGSPPSTVEELCPCACDRARASWPPVVKKLLSTKGIAISQDNTATLEFGQCNPDLPQTLTIRVHQTDYDDMSEAYSAISGTTQVREFLDMYVNGEHIGSCDPTETNACGTAYTCAEGVDVKKYLFQDVLDRTIEKRTLEVRLVNNYDVSCCGCDGAGQAGDFLLDAVIELHGCLRELDFSAQEDDGDDLCYDCNSIALGPNRLDNCGACDSDLHNDCAQDCYGVWGGNAREDDCGACGHHNKFSESWNIACADCEGVPYGDKIADNCGQCDNDPTNDCRYDCAGTWGGYGVSLQECVDNNVNCPEWASVKGGMSDCSSLSGPARGRLSALRVSHSESCFVAVLYGRTGRSTAENGCFRPGQ